MSDPLTSLVKKIDEKVNEASPKYRQGQKLGAFLILPDAPGRADELRSFAECETSGRVTFSLGAFPPRYEINPEAAVTVVIYTPGRPGQQSVTANFALRECDLDEATENAIAEALVKVLPR